MQKKFDSTERTKSIKHLVIHSFALSVPQMLETLYQYGLSVHYMIESDGTVHSLVSEDHVAWHAGPSFWAGETSLNQTSIGIELEHPQYGQTFYPQKQIDSLIKLAKNILKRHHIRPENIVGHSDIAPAFKIDPGKGFPWEKLSEQGIGLWYNLKNSDQMENLNIEKLLEIIGYTAQTQRQLEAAVWAFYQRFMPNKVPTDPQLVEREKAVFKARQIAAGLPEEKRAEFLKTTPVIYPKNIRPYLIDTTFIKVLQSVAYQYQKARKS